MAFEVPAQKAGLMNDGRALLIEAHNLGVEVDVRRQGAAVLREAFTELYKSCRYSTVATTLASACPVVSLH